MRPLPTLCIVAALAFLAAPVRADDPPPTFDAARALYADGNYKDALAAISQLQQLTGKAAEGLDRFALFMLKGETQLRLHDGASALNAFVLSFKEAATADQKDQSLAMQDLLRRSANEMYHPRLNADGSEYTDVKTYDITDLAARKEAFAALLIDEMTPFAKNFEQIKSTGTLAQIVDYLKQLPTIRAVEKTVTTKSDKCDAITTALRDRALALIDTSLDAGEKQVAAIKIDANKTYQSQVDVTDPNTKKVTRKNVQLYVGPTMGQVSTLKALSITCEKTKAQIDELTADLQLAPEAVKVRVARNDKLYQSIQTLLTFDFTKPVVKGAGGGVPGGGGGGGMGPGGGGSRIGGGGKSGSGSKSGG